MSRKTGAIHFTPPELQGTTNFKTLQRTQNHDNFGLALLIFHLLFGGRHPYAGVPLIKGAGDALESDIQAMRYAYARDAQQRGIGVPPRSYPITLLPPTVEPLMHAAFTEQGAKGHRPTAAQWVHALDEIRKTLRTCSKAKTHTYPGHLMACPWCSMASDPFPDPDVASAAANAPVFELDKVWALIDSVRLPNSFGTVPSHANYSPSGKPARKHGEGRHMMALGLVVLASVIGGYMVGLPWIALLAMVVGLFIRPLVKGYDGGPEVVERQASLRVAEHEYNAAVTALNSGVKVPTAEFHKQKAQFQQTASALRTIPSQLAQEMSKIEGLARAYHLRKHLERFFVDDVRIKGLGPSRKASLKSFGIETAADVVEADVRQVKGFGGSLTQALLDWRASHERSFVFAAHMRPPASEVARLQREERAARTPLEMELRKAPEVLKGLIVEAQRQHSMLMPRVEAAAKALAQAHADLAEANLAMR